MKKALRSNFEPGSPREAVRRAQWKALGLTDEDMLKPKIAVVNSSSELAICFSHLDGIAKVVKDAVRDAGGLPFEIRTAAPSDFIISAGASGGYMLASRDLIVNDMEIAVEGAQLDGMVCLSSCDKTPPAHLMAAGRFNVPTILVMCGYQPSGHFEGKHVDIEDVFLGSVQAMFGKLSKDTLRGMCDHAIGGPGVCSGMGTANSMHIVCEALGMALPGCAPVLANSPKMFDFARRSGRRIVEMVWDDLKPRDILTPGAFRNAAAAVLAVSGSINCIKHLQATAIEAGVDVDVFQLFNDLGEDVPVLSAVSPNGVGHDRSVRSGRRREGADEAARAAARSRRAHRDRTDRARQPRRRRRVGRRRDSSARAALLRQAARSSCCTDRSRPRARSSSSACADRAGRRGSTGTAAVYENGLAAIEGIEKGDVRPGHVLVVRGMGPKGGPGMAGPASRVVFALDAAGLTDEVAFVSDGQLSGLCLKGIMVAEVSPESAVGGPLALVENGDRIRIDVDARTLDLDVPEAELIARRVRRGEPALPKSKGYLSIYQRSVQPMSTGAVLIKQD